MALDFLQILKTKVPPVTGTYASVRTAGNVTASSVQAIEYPTNWKERGPSNAVYTAAYRDFAIESDDIAALTPKPRDTYTISDGTFTVMSVEEVAAKGFVILHTVSLSILGDLKDTVNLQHPAITSDANLGRSESWSNVRTSVHARVQPDDVTPFEGRGMRASVASYRVFIDPSTGSGSTFTAANSAGDMGRLVFGSVTLTIDGYRDAERVDDLPVITARKLP
jgi:hypothetical protein